MTGGGRDHKERGKNQPQGERVGCPCTPRPCSADSCLASTGRAYIETCTPGPYSPDSCLQSTGWAYIIQKRARRGHQTPKCGKTTTLAPGRSGTNSPPPSECLRSEVRCPCCRARGQKKNNHSSNDLDETETTVSRHAKAARDAGTSLATVTNEADDKCELCGELFQQSRGYHVRMVWLVQQSTNLHCIDHKFLVSGHQTKPPLSLSIDVCSPLHPQCSAMSSQCPSCPEECFEEGEGADDIGAMFHKLGEEHPFIPVDNDTMEEKYRKESDKTRKVFERYRYLRWRPLEKFGVPQTRSSP